MEGHSPYPFPGIGGIVSKENSKLVSFSIKSGRPSLYPVKCLEAPLSINHLSRVSEGDAAERADIRIYSFLLLSTTLDSSYLEFLDLLKD